MMMSSFIEFLGHRKYGGVTVMQAFNAIEIAAPTRTQRIKGNPRHIVEDEDYQSYIDRHSGKAQVYVGLNPVKSDLKGFPTDKDVLIWCNELLDLDLEKPKLIDEDVPDGYPKEYKHYAAREDDLKKLEPFIDRINKWLTDHGFKTGYQDHTGNGGRWILPIPGLDLIGHDLEALAAKKKEFKERIARECGIVDGCGAHLDSVFDFRRITGVPGTLNFKLETATRKNRIREPFRGTERDEDVALRDHIVAIELPKETARTPTGDAAPSLEHWMNRDDKLKRLYEGDTTGYESRSHAEYALCCKLAFYRFPESQAEDILLSAGIGKAAEKKKSGHNAYITNTVRKAFAAQTERIQEKKAAGTQAIPRGYVEDYFNEKTFVPKRLADTIMSRHDFKTMRDTGEVFIYAAGVYVGKAATIIEAEAQTELDHKSTTHRINEVVGYIRRATYVDREDFDTDVSIINLDNGLFDFEAMEIKPHTPEYLSLHKSPIVYDVAATCQRTDQFFGEVLRGKDVAMMYELFGYALVKDKRMSEAVILEGATGDNGKSTMIDLLISFVGEQATSGVTPNQMEGDPFAVSDMFGALLNAVDDLGDTPLSRLGVFKSAIAGKRIRAQNKFERAYYFKPDALCVFACNDVPESFDTSDAFFKRMILIPFPNTFKGSDKDNSLIDELTSATAISGLFNKAIVAAKKAIDAGKFTGVGTVEDKRREYTYASNSIARFIDKNCTMNDPDDYIEKDVLYNQYILWARDYHFVVKDMGSMTSLLKKLGVLVVQVTDDNGWRKRAYKGINIKVVS